MDTKPVKISATVYWAFLNKKDMNDKYSVELGNISADDVEKLEGLGLNVKFNENKPEKGHFITCVSKNFEFKALDKSGEVIDGLVGNGSKCKAMIGTYSWTFKNKKGVSPSLKKLVITDLVSYNPAEDDEDEDDDL